MKHRRGLSRSVWIAILALGSLTALGGSSCEADRGDVAQEQALRQAAEAACTHAQQALSNWQLLAIAALIAAAVLLIVGTAWGSRARHDAKARQQEPSDERAKRPG